MNLKRWALVVLLPVLGVVGGSLLALALPPVYTAEARLVVGQSTLRANMVPGYALATQEIASNYARFVAAGPVLSAMPSGDAGRVRSVTASPIPSSNIIRVEATATAPRSARKAAATAAELLQRQVSMLSPEVSAKTTLIKYTRMSRSVAAMQATVADAEAVVARLRSQRGASADSGASTSIRRARSALADDSAELASLQAQQAALNALYQSQASAGPSASAVVAVQQAEVVSQNVMSRVQLYGLAGFGFGALLGLFAKRRIEQPLSTPALNGPAGRGSLPLPRTLKDTRTSVSSGKDEAIAPPRRLPDLDLAWPSRQD